MYCSTLALSNTMDVIAVSGVIVVSLVITTGSVFPLLQEELKIIDDIAMKKAQKNLVMYVS
jgi:hypothetical protein